MNKRNDWKSLLKMANEELSKQGIAIHVKYDKENGTYSCFIGDVLFADNYYENELSDLINDAWANAKNSQDEKIFTTYVDEIFFQMKLSDAKYCYHKGECDDDVKDTIQSKEYIQEQLKNINKEDIIKALFEYGVDFDENNRTEMEEILVWLAAGNILDEQIIEY